MTQKYDMVLNWILYWQDIPEAIPPLGPDSESDEDIQLKRNNKAPDHQVRASPRKPPPRKRKRDSEAKSKPPKSKEFMDSDDSDSEPVSRVKRSASARATSASPKKTHSPRHAYM